MHELVERVYGSAEAERRQHVVGAGVTLPQREIVAMGPPAGAVIE